MSATVSEIDMTIGEKLKSHSYSSTQQAIYSIEERAQFPPIKLQSKVTFQYVYCSCQNSIMITRRKGLGPVLQAPSLLHLARRARPFCFSTEHLRLQESHMHVPTCAHSQYHPRMRPRPGGAAREFQEPHPRFAIPDFENEHRNRAFQGSRELKEGAR